MINKIKFVVQVVYRHYKREGIYNTLKELSKQLRLKGFRGVKNHIINISHTQMQNSYINEESHRKFKHLVDDENLPEKGKMLEVVRENFSVSKELPKVSVIIPVYNNYFYTLRCLYSLAISTDANSFEVIIADDLSSDETFQMLGSIEGICYIRNPENLGFLRSCNNAVKHASGQYIFLLNNDTAVLDGWLDNLITTFEENENVGLVGSKLIYPNGMLQEAGGILWKDGAANYGKFQDPNSPEYSYMREVDYVSGAAIMVNRKLWEQLGGFDERYAPAYCEDSDFCLNLRSKGYKVLMQPTSEVIHFEGISSGTDINSGVKQYQVVNSEKLKDKWKAILATNGEHGDFSRACVDRSKGPRILFIDAVIPTPDQDAGSLTVWYFLKILKQLGYQITFIPKNLANSQPYTKALQRIGVECLYSPYLTNIEEYLEENGKYFDSVFLYRVAAGGDFYESVRKYAPQAKVIFDTVDIHFLRLERQAELEQDTKKALDLYRESQIVKKRELFLLENADVSIVLSDYEKEMLSKDYGTSKTFVIPLALEIPGSRKEYSKRKDIAFIGGYQHTPNVDAVLYFVESFWPSIKEKIPGVKFYVIGSKPTEELKKLPLNDDDIIVTGFVESLDPFLDSLRLTVAPLRYGAGIKGKIGSSLSYGVPCVATEVAAEGMGLENGVNILMANDQPTFIESVQKLYSEESTWISLSHNGLNFVETNYSIEMIRKKLQELLGD